MQDLVLNSTSDLKREGKSFYWASFFLPKKYRLNAGNLYSICRYFDNIADKDQNDQSSYLRDSLREIKEDKEATPPLIKTDRGGKITFHGPGQKIFYFILNLKYLPFKPTDLTRNILQTTSETLNSYSLENIINLKDPGIYINAKKLASVGMRI